MEIGAQLYTLRNQCQDLEGLSESLKKVADMGYQYIQLSGVCPYDPDWMKAQLEKNGLRCVLTHSPMDRMMEAPEAVAAEHSIFGCNRIGIGYYPLLDEGLEIFLNKVTPLSRKFRSLGKYLMYHNHDHEFSRLDGKTYMDHILERTSAEDLGITLDTYWVQAGGADPVQWLHRVEGRSPVIHMKDMGYQRRICPIGEGNMNYESILHAAEDTHVKYALVELDDCYGEDPFDCLKRSYQCLKAMGLTK